MRMWCTVDIPIICTCYTEDVRVEYSWCAHCMLMILIWYAHVMRCWYAHAMHMIYLGCAHDMQLSDVGTVCLWCAHHLLMLYTVHNTIACPWYSHVTLKMWAPYAYHMHVICLCETLLICACYAHVIPRMCARYAVDVRTVSLWYVMLLYTHVMHCWYFHGIYMLYRGCAHGMQLMCAPWAYDMLCYYMRMRFTVDISI